MEELFLFEVFIESVNFAPTGGKYPKPGNVLISIEVLNSIKMDISLSLFKITASEKPTRSIEFQCGKSSLFPKEPNRLIDLILKRPIIIKMFNQEQLLGIITIEWPKSFLEMVRSVIKNPGPTTPVALKDKFLLINQNSGKILADVEALIRLSCLGDNIQTNYQILNPDSSDKEGKSILLKTEQTNATFQCRRMTEDFKDTSDMLPLGPMLNAYLGDSKSKTRFSIQSGAGEVSWTALFNAKNDKTDLGSSFLTFDIISIIDRPDERKFLDLQIKQQQSGFIIRIDNVDESESHRRLMTKVKDLNNLDQLLAPDLEDERLTSHYINQHLCHHKNCPASMKFRDLGIGPLAPSNGLGTITAGVRVPNKYGFSQAYGTWDKYGPYGVFTKPKRPEQPFIPKTDFETDFLARFWKAKHKEEREKANKQERKERCYEPSLRLNSFGNKKDFEVEPLRLYGGGIIDYVDSKNPLSECKEIMDQLDCVVKKFRNALGPCGRPTCAHAPNLAQEVCKNVCCKIHADSDRTCITVPLKINPASPPLAIKSACGNPNCKYINKKLGITSDEDYLEIQYMPPSTGMCGSPICPEVPLPTIHWDCPEPLPQGPCKNPICPYLPEDLKKLNDAKILFCENPKTVANNHTCDNPTCAVRLRSGSDICGSPKCPFVPPEAQIFPDICTSPECFNPDCLYSIQMNALCQNPECPYTEQTNQPVSEGPVNDLCQNPECPYLEQTNQLASLQSNKILNNGFNTYSTQPLGKGDSSLQSTCFPQQYNLQDQKSDFPKDTCLKIQYVDQSTAPSQQSNYYCTNPNCPFQNPNVLNLIPIHLRPYLVCANEKCPFKSTAPIEICLDQPCRFLRDQPATNFVEEGRGDKRKSSQYYTRLTSLKSDEDSKRTSEYKRRRSSYRPTIQADIKPDMEAVEVTSGTRIEMDYAPCRPDSCKKFGGKLECLECDEENQKRTSEYKRRRSSYRPTIQADVKPDMEAVEVTSGTRIEMDYAPCRPDSCKKFGGKLECLECDEENQKRTSEYKRRRSSYRPTIQADIKPDMEAVDVTSGTRIDMDSRACTPKTCLKKGGILECTECLEKQSEGEIKSKRRKSKRRVKSTKYNLSIGDKYPGVKRGHKICYVRPSRVPFDQGWLWNIIPKSKKGWRPGVIGKMISERIREYWQSKGIKPLDPKRFRKRRKGGNVESDEEDIIDVKPRSTLQIQKRNGAYYITLHPLKDPATVVKNEDPYMDCTPMQFKVIKPKLNLNDACLCGKENGDDSSSTSDLDIEFTPPAGLIRPERFQPHIHTVHTDTQYNTKDFISKTEKPKEKKKGGKKGNKTKKK